MSLNYRYPGANSFEKKDSRIFFGRDTDIKNLYESFFFQKHIILHSRSGLGKSSLVNAGLMPLFDIKKDLGLPFRFHIYNKDNKDTLKNKLINIINSYIKNLGVNTRGEEKNKETHYKALEKLIKYENTLWYAVKKLQIHCMKEEENSKEADNKESQINIFFCFDQFEEILSYPPKERYDFKKELSELLFTPIPFHIKKDIYEMMKSQEAGKEDVFSASELSFLFKESNIRFLFIMRSERLSEMDNFADYFPEILKYLYELKPLTESQCSDAIVKPAVLKNDEADIDINSPPFNYTKEAVTHIIEGLSVNGKAIETNQLQWVLRHCENIIRVKFKESGKETFLIIEKNDIGPIVNIIENSLNNILNGLEIYKHEVEVILQDKFIFNNSRVPVLAETLHEKLEKNIIDYLLNERILRKETYSSDIECYELSHDTLVKPIREALEKRLKEEKKAALELKQKQELQNAKEKAEQSEKAAKNQRKLFIITFIFLLFFIGLAIVAFYLRKDAVIQRKNAVKEQLKAERNLSNYKISEIKRTLQPYNLQKKFGFKDISDSINAFNTLFRAANIDINNNDVQKGFSEDFKKSYPFFIDTLIVIKKTNIDTSTNANDQKTYKNELCKLKWAKIILNK